MPTKIKNIPDALKKYASRYANKEVRYMTYVNDSRYYQIQTFNGFSWVTEITGTLDWFKKITN